ncbi:MAG: family 78 glycoside hydrolase catalytic domain [Candidatus Sigynarchaeota archaeon]
MFSKAARWIWLDYITPWVVTGEFMHDRVVGLKPCEKNRFGMFRKSFTLPIVPESAMLDITVDGRYEVFINGQYIGRGIYRCNKHSWYYDEYDIARFLHEGKNVICVIAQFFGEQMSWYEPMPHGGIAGRSIGKGGLLFQADIKTRCGILSFHSDATTRARPCDAWQQDVPLVQIGLPYVEIFDARRFPWSWLDLDFDDSGPEWGHVVELRLNDILPELVPCDIPRLVETKRRAASITSTGIIQEFFDDEDIRESMTDPATGPIDFFVQMGKSTYKSTSCSTAATWASGQPLVLELGSDPRGIVFDMGEEVTGFVYLDAVASEPGITIDLAWGEKLDPAKGNTMPLVHAFKEKHGSRYICRQGENVHRLFHWFGFRYIQANVKGRGTLIIRDLGTILYNYPVEQAGSFSCDDERITKLYEACTRTLRNCMHDGYEDCPSREQRQWIGDAYIEILVNFAVFGDTALAKKLIKQCAQSQRGDGLTEMCCPGDHEIHGLLIHDYCLYWMNIVYQYYWYTGETSIIESMMPSMLKAIGWFTRHVHPVTGLATNLPNWTFIDWSVNDKWGACCPLNAHLYITIKQLAEMGKIIGWDKAIEHLEGIADSIAKGINHYLWDEQRGAYVDAVDVDDKGVVTRRSKKVTFHSNALVILHGIASEPRVNRIITGVFERPYKDLYIQNAGTIWRGITAPRLAEERHVIVAEPFFFHHVNQALAKVGRHDIIARFLKDGWCKMLDLGSTTIWETWGDFGSLCHAWSTTPAHDLARHCLGVRITRPGAAEVLVAPALMGLSKAEGAVPTIKGLVKVRWRYDEQQRSFLLEIDVPAGMSVSCKAPRIEGHECIEETRMAPEREYSTRMVFQYK